MKNKIDWCSLHLGEVNPTELVKRGFIVVTAGEITTKKPFALLDSFRRWGITVKGPVGLEENVTIGRSVITGPAYISENSRIFSSHLRGTPTGASLYWKKLQRLGLFGSQPIPNRRFIDDTYLQHK